MNLIRFFIFLTVKDSYLTFILLKISNFLGKYFTHFFTISLKKNTKINLKIETKSSD